MDKQLIQTIMDIACRMTKVGAEVSRVEESIQRICRAYGYAQVDVFATTATIILSVEAADGKGITLHRRVQQLTVDIETLDRLNSLVRWMTAETPSLPQVKEKLRELQQVRHYPTGLTVLFQGIIAAAFCVFFGGRSWQEATTAFAAGLLIGAMLAWLEWLHTNPLFVRFVCSFAASMAVQGLLAVGFIQSPRHIIIGVIMCLIPGVGLTNALRDLFAGDVFTGILRSMQALLLTVAIALGFALPPFFFGGVV